MDFAPPSGPPPPKVPEGWKAVWNDQYKEWFYVNLHTKQSQWDKPTEPVYASGDAPPPGPPPTYDHDTSKPVGLEKGGLASNNPFNSVGAGGTSNSTADDEAYARQLQAEEDARARASSSRGASDSYYGSGAPGGDSYGQQAYGQQAYGQQSPTGEQDRGKKGGFLSGLKNKLGGSGSRPPQQSYGGGYPPQQQYGQGYGQGYPPQYGGGYGGPQQYPQQGYYGPPGGGAYPQQQPQKRHGGMGAGGGALLGAGAGLVGGALLMDAIDDHEDHEQQEAYDQGYDQGMDDGGDMGGDF